MRIVRTDQAPRPLGHYAQAVVHQGTVYVAGQIPIDPATGDPVTGPIKAQARRALDNLDAILRAAGSDREHVLKTTVYIADASLSKPFNEAYAAWFGGHAPARAMVPVPTLPLGVLVEIEAVAAEAG